MPPYTACLVLLEPLRLCGMMYDLKMGWMPETLGSESTMRSGTRHESIIISGCRGVCLVNLAL